MSYQINKTDGTLLTEVIDGQIDQSSTNITLFGKNFSGYGEFLNENFIKLLENFASSAPPSNPIDGQTWWDKSENRLKIYDGNVWKISGGPYVQNTQPQMVTGDLWINNQTNQLYAYDGTDLILIGPSYSQAQGTSGFEVSSIIDTQARSRTILKLNISGNLVAVYSDLEFTPISEQVIADLVSDENPTGIIYKGINIVDSSNFVFRGISSSAAGLVTSQNETITVSQLLPSDRNGVTTGTLSVQNAGGIIIGPSQNNIQKVIGDNFYIENQIRDHNLNLRVRSSVYGGTIVDAISIDSQNGRVGIFNTDRNPAYTLDVEGDLRITGNLLVEGDTTSIEVATLSIEDKNIELAKLSDSTIGDDTVVDDGGIILKSTDGDKTLLWKNSTDSWTSNQHVDLSASNLVYKINGSTKLTTDSLSNILYADDLVRIGTLQNLDVDNININNNIVKAGALTALGDPSDNAVKLRIIGTSGIDITAYGDISITDNRKITGVANPTSNQDVATKIYVDNTIATEDLAMSLDITGLSDPNAPGVGDGPTASVATLLAAIYPPSSNNNGKVARIVAVSYSNVTVTGVNVTIGTSPDTTKVLTKSLIAVDSNGTQNESVVQDIVSSNPAGGIVSLTPSRYLMTYTCNGAAWVHNDTSSL